MHTQITIIPKQFGDQERPLAAAGVLRASGFRFPGGVCAVRLVSDQGELVILPFQGQQIWSVRFGDRTLTMHSPFEQPRSTREFLHTFGGFLQHCGVTGVGGPGPEDSHPLHGELPNAPYDAAHIVVGEDDAGAYIGVTGTYRHTVAFGVDYTAEPLVLLRPQRTRFTMRMTITNRSRSPMDLLYLAHVNFRPVDGGRLVYSAAPAADSVRVRASIPGHITPGPGYREFVADLAEDPRRHEVLDPDLPLDPEVVFFIDYVADDEGWAHSMQVHPDGAADYIGHRPDQLPRATRWISRTPDQDAIALVEPGTCEPEGYHAEREKGNVRTLAAGEAFQCELVMGHLSPEETRQMEEKIRAVSDEGS